MRRIPSADESWGTAAVTSRNSATACLRCSLAVFIAADNSSSISIRLRLGRRTPINCKVLQTCCFLQCPQNELFRLFFAMVLQYPRAHRPHLQVSFMDSENIRHSVEVTASTLYEAAVLAMAEFRRCGFTANAPGPATRLMVTVKMPTTSHEVQVGKIEAWLQSAGKPNEQGMKGRLRELLRM